MEIEHLALWVENLEEMKAFYCTYFHMTANEKYHNPAKNFTSYFLSFESGARIELMHKPGLVSFVEQNDLRGFNHIAISVGSKAKVLEMTEKLRKAGFEIKSEPRTTGDGYFESVISDPEGNSIELTI
ncbi:VOC family protein [Algoriphagus sp. SE2]|uniref:VOC family protein n=1 Tax=Algoriphagus sp. SE2 TaxID=3141536 RepID=UPI0031CD3AAD